MNLLIFSLSFRNLRKNKRSTFSIAIGLFITLTLFSAVNFNLSLYRNDLIRQNVGLDFSIQGTYSYMYPLSDFLKDNKTWNKIASEPEIASVLPYMTSHGYYDNQTTNLHYSYSLYGVNSSYIESLRSTEKLQLVSGFLDSNSSFPANSIPVIGIKTTSTNTSFSEVLYTNGPTIIHLLIIGWVTVITRDTIFSSVSDIGYQSDFYYFNFIMNFQHLDNRVFQQGYLRITVKDQFIDKNNLDATANTFTKLITRLNQKYYSYEFYSSVPYAVIAVNAQLSIFQFIVFIFLLPLFFIACYISFLASQLNIESRRIQYGLYLARGGTGSTIKNSYRLEGILLGLFNGLLAYLLCPFVGFILHIWLPTPTLTGDLSEMVINYYSTQFMQLIWLFVLGSALGSLIMHLPNYYTFLNPKELLEYHRVEETDIKLKGRRDVIFFAIGVSPFVIGVIVVSVNILQLPFIATLLLLNIGIFVIYIVPFSPLLITYGLSGFLSRQPFLLNKIGNLYSKFIPELKEVLNKTITSKINNLTRIAFIIAFSFTFIIVPLIASASIQQYDNQILAFRIGSDMAIDNFDSTLINQSMLLQNDFVQSVSFVQWTYYNSIYFLFINVSSYLQTAHIQDYWNLNRNLLSKLTENSILVNQAFLNNYNLKIDDSFPVYNGSAINEYTIKGLFGAVGGSEIFSRTTPLILFSTPQNESSVSTRIIVKFKDPKNIELINKTINLIQSTDEQATILSSYQLNLSTQSFNITNFVLNIIDVQAYLLSFMSIGALLFLMIIRIKERTRELGNWRSRGLDSRQLQKLITAELFILSTFGFLIGLLCGVILTFILQFLLTDVLFGPNNIIPYFVIIPYNILIPFAIYIIGTLMLALFINYWARNMNIAKQLHYEEYMR